LTSSYLYRLVQKLKVKTPIYGAHRDEPERQTGKHIFNSKSERKTARPKEEIAENFWQRRELTLKPRDPKKKIAGNIFQRRDTTRKGRERERNPRKIFVSGDRCRKNRERE